MSDFTYTNAEFRSILNGLGFRNRNGNEPDYPISTNESSLDQDQQAVMNFQDYFNLTVDGIVGPQTRATAKKAMFVVQYELDLVMKPDPRLRPQNAPFYGQQTARAIGNFRSRYGFEPNGNANDDRIADLVVRRKLDQLVPSARSEAEALEV